MTKPPVALAILLMAAAGCNQNAAYGRLAEAHRLSADIGAQFARATDAANRAVMADTDAGSMKFAQEARSAADAVEAGATALAQVLTELGYSAEMRLLEDFQRRFVEYRTLDNTVLALAVEGTNLKARQLSYGPVLEAADAFRGALDGLVSANTADTWRVKAHAAMALASAREIQALQAPHIAEPADAAMTQIETRMAAAAAASRNALLALAPLVSPGSRSEIATATAALDRLVSLNSEVTSLSRRNTNVRALALALGQKRVLATACENAARAFQDAIAQRGLPMR